MNRDVIAGVSYGYSTTQEIYTNLLLVKLVNEKKDGMVVKKGDGLSIFFFFKLVYFFGLFFYKSYLQCFLILI